MAAALVQESSSSDTDPAFGSDVTDGNVILVCQVTQDWAGEPIAPTRVSGTATLGTITKIAGANNAAYGGIALYWAEVTGTGSLTLTGSDYLYHISEWSGLDLADLVEDWGLGTHAGTSPTSEALTTAAETAVLMWFGCWVEGGVTVTPPSGYTNWASTQNLIAGGYDESVSAGTPTPAFSTDGSRNLNILSVALNVASGGGAEVEISGSATLTFSQTATLRDGAATGRRVHPGGWSFYPAQGAS